jgi:UDP-N-acetylglucosamine 2-epimerase (non-hydrolysing)
VVQGDTNTANASAQAAHYLGIPVVHVEAGLRSWDRAMPEEINRMIVGVVADLHCCATEGNAAHLRAAGVRDDAIVVTGNPIVEATLATLPDGDEQRRLLDAYHLDDGGFVLATIHRPENVDDGERLTAILAELGHLPWPIVLPLHPRTADRIQTFGLEDLANALRIIAPIDHRSFLALAARARVVVSDSGGVQEEVTVLKKPLVVVRNSTERPEAVAAGFSVMAQPDEIAGAVGVMAAPAVAARLVTLPCPFGDGHAGQRIAAATCALADRDPSGSATKPRSFRQPRRLRSGFSQ